MNFLDIIEKKKNGEELSEEEIVYFINKYTGDEIPDYQAAALIMAICINGMTSDEILALTKAMAESGDIIDLSDIADIIVDKHSTGGIGDKITLIISPIIAALGIPVAKLSGRGLGITGGTIDKLESIPYYNVNLSIDEFKQNVRDIKLALMAQTLNLTPADKKIYALRDVIGCVDSIPLIASSIMSKKIASGANRIMLDVTCGKGSFLKTKEQAKSLAKLMTLIGEWSGKETKCIITNMDEPLGYAVGNSLEVIEAVKALKGEMAEDIKDVILNMGVFMIKLAGCGNDITINKKKILEVIEDGSAYEKFKELVVRQGGDVTYIEDLQKFEKAPIIIPLIAETEGYVEELDANIVGRIVLDLGAGRKEKEDIIDTRVGIIFSKKIGDEVSNGDVLAYVHASDAEKAAIALQDLRIAYKIGDRIIKKKNIIEIL